MRSKGQSSFLANFHTSLFSMRYRLRYLLLLLLFFWHRFHCRLRLFPSYLIFTNDMECFCLHVVFHRQTSRDYWHSHTRIRNSICKNFFMEFICFGWVGSIKALGLSHFFVFGQQNCKKFIPLVDSLRSVTKLSLGLGPKSCFLFWVLL